MKVQRRQCETCIYRPGTSFDLARLEAEVADPRMPGHFQGFRICHHSTDVVCAGFHVRHGANCTPIQVAERLGMLERVEVDTLADGLSRDE